MRIRWYVTDLPFIPGPSLINSRDWDSEPWKERLIGEVPTWSDRRSYNAKWQKPAGLTGAHQCRSEWFATGQPWPVEGEPTVYDDEWIPACCEREMACITEQCSQDPVNGKSASQHIQFPVPQQDATADTPYTIQQVATDQGGTVPDSGGSYFALYPTGSAGPRGYEREIIGNPAGYLTSFRERIDTAADSHVQDTWDATGWTLEVTSGGVTGRVTASIVGGVLEIGGTNATIALALLPATVAIQTFGQPGPAGSTWATATELTHTDNVVSGFTPGEGVRLPTAPYGVWPMVSVNNSNAANTLRVYADYSQGAIYDDFGSGILDHVDLPPKTVAVFRQTNPSRWTIVALYRWTGAPLPPAGAISAVGITTTSGGVSVSSTTVGGVVALTVDIDADLNALAALGGTNTIYYRSAASTWSAVSIGDFLDFTSGTLKVVPPTATSGETVCTTFSITGTSGTFQATGNTFTLPAAGTYLVTAKIRADIQTSAGGAGWITARLRNTTDAADVSNSEVLIAFTPATATRQIATGSLVARITVTGSKTFEVYGARFGTSWTISDVCQSDANGYSVIEWARLF